MLGDLPSIVPRRNYDIRTQCLKGTCSSSELPGRWHVSLFLDDVRPCRGRSSMSLRKRPHGKDGRESQYWIGSIVLVFRMERMTGFGPAVSAWEAGVLPLHHIRMAGVPERFRTVSPPIGDRRAFPHPGTKASLRGVGFEPTTSRL